MQELFSEPAILTYENPEVFILPHERICDFIRRILH